MASDRWIEHMSGLALGIHTSHGGPVEINETGPSVTITDDATPRTSVIAVSETSTVNSLDLTLSLYHKFVGDLSITLTSPSATVATIAYRIGRAGFPNFGDASDFGTFDYSALCKALGGAFCAAPTPLDYKFDDAGVDIWAAAVAVGPEVAIPADTYYASREWQSGDPSGTGVQVLLNTVFADEAVNGNWTLTITDHDSDDAGELTGWALHISAGS